MTLQLLLFPDDLQHEGIAHCSDGRSSLNSCLPLDETVLCLSRCFLPLDNAYKGLALA